MRFARLTVIGLALVMAASGCTSGPSLKEAAAELQRDTQRLETNGVFKNPLKKLRILQRPDKDVPCDKEKFRRVLRATADYERINEPMDSHLGRSQALMENVLVQDFGYKLEHEYSQMDTDEGRFIHGVKKGLGITVTVYVAPEAPTWRLDAMTPCLPR
ncbi:hypothetical protein SAMN05216276_102481 [Streptosporangium subroseum]|uniref:Lipoprotein n=1 Tax=Streptosporangium subroseum TaxID=106412 RepID=A0A239JXS4_9ACTN|nr:hypothetical protein [Streptosporangium subroseum]SNT10459.1 hypothetical protein SAMN05216276_102481 [Streptosporangium subroseum]